MITVSACSVFSVPWASMTFLMPLEPTVQLHAPRSESCLKMSATFLGAQLTAAILVLPREACGETGPNPLTSQQDDELKKLVIGIGLRMIYWTYDPARTQSWPAIWGGGWGMQRGKAFEYKVEVLHATEAETVGKFPAYSCRHECSSCRES